VTVSNKDRDAAITAANTSFDTWSMQDGMLAAAMVDALIAHGWGPTKAAVIEELQLWLESGRAREQGLVGAWEFEAKIAHLRGEDHPMLLPRRQEVTE
jgi:hypothetical protein